MNVSVHTIMFAMRTIKSLLPPSQQQQFRYDDDDDDDSVRTQKNRKM